MLVCTAFPGAVEGSPTIAGTWSADVWTGIGPPRGSIAQKPDADWRLGEVGEPGSAMTRPKQRHALRREEESARAGVLPLSDSCRSV